ncbi:TPA_asm: hypothetical protein GF967_09785 [Listeria monocytogenes]|uniref:hypothetical protein n=1 Tax=Listeria monocytogenes TaxID=1639 RepID=UPI000874F2B5|nr:hypothetical protein [Listeria monocytogenes]EAC5123973.1 hypothetical protein [Listeria monocytogenes]EAC7613640.1 hypothetical protein [Listeria monocytogenes]EAC7704687.1 hypothetical protein [Listeria monocytogenes]EAC8108511.1 hypothetical protein [Listeria monocytogenes]EAC8383085.1 hypothetical protein [Listeria monocytogenes]
MTNDEARQYFIDKGLSYEKIKDYDIYLLQYFVAKELAKMEKIKDYEFCKLNSPEIHRAKTGIKQAYMTVRSHYYDSRESISFNKCGFIGFAGWASSNNVAPHISGFIKWCDFIAEIELEGEA